MDVWGRCVDVCGGMHTGGVYVCVRVCRCVQSHARLDACIYKPNEHLWPKHRRPCASSHFTDKFCFRDE